MTRDALVLIQSAVVRAACEQRTERDLATLRASVDQAANVPAGDGWEHRAAAHVEFHTCWPTRPVTRCWPSWSGP